MIKNLSPSELERYPQPRLAQTRLTGRVTRTPVLESSSLNRALGAQVFFKCENLQRAGAFKIRGATHALLRLTGEERAQGVVAFSSGNHAQAVALAAGELGIRATIVMPADAPEFKIAATRAYLERGTGGGEVILYDRMKEDREAIARSIQARTGSILIPPYDHPDVIAGQGTAALELFQEVGPLDLLLVCVGGGGLIAGSALAAQSESPQCAVWGVEPAAGNDAAQSFQAQKRIKIAVPQTIADGARTQMLGELPFEIILKTVSGFVSVTDAELRAAMQWAARDLKLVVEPTGALGIAAVLNPAVLAQKISVEQKKVGVIVSGGNVDLSSFAELIANSK